MLSCLGDVDRPTTKGDAIKNKAILPTSPLEQQRHPGGHAITVPVNPSNLPSQSQSPTLTPQNQPKQDLYKNRPQEVTPRLVQNIVRDSCDPGALGVFASGGRLPTPRPANELLAKFGGPVLVAQGMLDPLNDAKGRAALLERAHERVDVAALEGGHCPHDEVPEQLAAALRSFVDRVLRKEGKGGERAVVAPVGAAAVVFREGD